MDTVENTADDATARVAKHRRRVGAGGSRRVEVTVPVRDAELLKALARTLRAGGNSADRVRKELESLVTTSQVRTGAELVAFLRASPLVAEQLVTERDRSVGRSADLEP